MTRRYWSRPVKSVVRWPISLHMWTKILLTAAGGAVAVAVLTLAAQSRRDDAPQAELPVASTDLVAHSVGGRRFTVQRGRLARV
jgi:hypothetical protein